MRLILSSKIRNLINKKLLKNFNPIFFNGFSKLPLWISSHPDNNFLKFENFLFTFKSNKTFIVKKKLYKNYKIIFIKKIPHKNYKFHTQLNVKIIESKKIAIANTKLCSKIVLNYLTNLNYTIIHTNQGYSNCSTIFVNNTLITSDKSIYKNTLNYFKKVILIKEPILLLNYGLGGFIGGASFVFKDKIYFFGSPSQQLRKILIENNIKFENFFNISDKIIDAGGGLLINGN